VRWLISSVNEDRECLNENLMIPLSRPPQTICIFRLSALGDATHVLPVIRQIQTHWPETAITWIVGKLENRLLEGLEGVERIVFDKRGGWSAIRTLRAQMYDRRFDILLQMQVAARANLLSRFVHAPVRLGWNRSRSRDFHHWFINEQVANVPQQHQVEGFLEFSKALGLPASSPVWNLPVSEEAHRWALEWLKPGVPNIVISPCSSHPLRNWKAENYAEIADFAIQQLGANILLSGGLSKLEIQTANTIEESMKHPCVNLVAKDTLEQSKALLQAADLLISPDSGPVHIANALGTPVLGLYAATWARRSGPYNSLELTVDRFPEAAVTFRGKDAADLRWGTRIEVPGVMDLVTTGQVKQKLTDWHAHWLSTR
jgi:heptosyltransferase I